MSNLRRGGDIRGVIKRFILGRPYGRGTNCSTDGTTIFSYRLPIARKIDGGIVLVYAGDNSKTTNKHIRGLYELRRLGFTLVEQEGRISQKDYALDKQERITRYATEPHAKCEDAGHCVEPVSDEEKCR